MVSSLAVLLEVKTTHSSAVLSLHLSQCFTPPLKSIPASFFPHAPCPPSWIPSLPAILTPRMCQSRIHMRLFLVQNCYWRQTFHQLCTVRVVTIQSNFSPFIYKIMFRRFVLTKSDPPHNIMRYCYYYSTQLYFGFRSDRICHVEMFYIGGVPVMESRVVKVP